MDVERSFRRSTIAGLCALGLSLGGHALTTPHDFREGCPVRRVTPSAWLFERVAPDPSSHSLVLKVARAALALALDVCA